MKTSFLAGLIAVLFAGVFRAQGQIDSGATLTLAAPPDLNGALQLNLPGPLQPGFLASQSPITASEEIQIAVVIPPELELQPIIPDRSAGVLTGNLDITSDLQDSGAILLQQVPEPSAVALTGLALGLLAVRKTRKVQE
jgi:hypothetical protein